VFEIIDRQFVKTPRSMVCPAGVGGTEDWEGRDGAAPGAGLMGIEGQAELFGGGRRGTVAPEALGTGRSVRGVKELSTTTVC